MKIKSLILIGLFVSTMAMAQQPFEKYGYKVKVSTLSRGKYVEDFTSDSLVQVGSVMINRVTGKIASFITYDTVYSEATLDPQLISRWMSIDPMSEEYYSHSPYNFVLNNPIINIDPDGRDVHVSFDSDEAREGYLRILNMGLEGQFKATLTAVKGKEGVFSVGFEAVDGGSVDNLSEQGQAFHSALSGVINDHETTVNLSAVYGDDHVQVGQYLSGKIDIADMEQYNVTGTDVEKSVGATQIGKMTHETVEQYEKAKYGVPQGSMEGFNIAHDAAIDAENRVNQNSRGKTYGSMKDYTIVYRDKEGRVIHTRTQTRDSWGNRLGVVQVTQPKPKGKKRN